MVKSAFLKWLKMLCYPIPNNTSAYKAFKKKKKDKELQKLSMCESKDLTESGEVNNEYVF